MRNTSNRTPSIKEMCASLVAYGNEMAFNRRVAELEAEIAAAQQRADLDAWEAYDLKLRGETVEFTDEDLAWFGSPVRVTEGA